MHKGPPMIYAFFECSRNIQSRFNYVCQTVEKVVFCVYTITCNENFLFSFFFSSLCFYWCSKQKVVNQSERLKHRSHFLKAPLVISEFTRQDGRKKKENGKTLVRDESGKAITIMSLSSLNINVFWSVYKKICLKESEVWRKVISNKIIVTLVTQALSSSFHFRPVT